MSFAGVQVKSASRYPLGELHRVLRGHVFVAFSVVERHVRHDFVETEPSIISALPRRAIPVGAPGFAYLEVPVQGEQLPRAEAAYDPYYSRGALLDASPVRKHPFQCCSSHASQTS